MLSLVLVVLVVTALSDGLGLGLGKAPVPAASSGRTVPTSGKTPAAGGRQAATPKPSSHQNSPAVTLHSIAENPCPQLYRDACYGFTTLNLQTDMTFKQWDGSIGGLPWKKKTLHAGKWLRFEKMQPFNFTIIQGMYATLQDVFFKHSVNFSVPFLVRFDPSPDAVTNFKTYQARQFELNTAVEKMVKKPKASQQQTQVNMTQKYVNLQTAFTAFMTSTFNATVYNYIRPGVTVDQSDLQKLNQTYSIIDVPSATVDSVHFHKSNLDGVFSLLPYFFKALNKTLTTFYVADYYTINMMTDIWVCSDTPHCI